MPVGGKRTDPPQNKMTTQYNANNSADLNISAKSLIKYITRKFENPIVLSNNAAHTVQVLKVEEMNFCDYIIDNSSNEYALLHDSPSCLTLYDALPHIISSETLCEAKRDSVETLFSDSSFVSDSDDSVSPTSTNEESVQYESSLSISTSSGEICSDDNSTTGFTETDYSVPRVHIHPQIFFNNLDGVFDEIGLMPIFIPMFFEHQMNTGSPSYQMDGNSVKKELSKAKPNRKNFYKLKTSKSVTSALKAYQTRPETTSEEALIRAIQKFNDLKISLARDAKKYNAQFQMYPFSSLKVGLDNNSLDALNDFTDALGNLSTKVPDQKSIPGVVHAITNVLSDDFTSVMKDIPFLIATIVTGSNFMTHPTRQNASVLVISICAYMMRFYSKEVFSFPKDLLSRVMGVVTHQTTDGVSFQPQMDDGHLSTILEFMTFCSYLYFSNAAPEGKKFEKLLKIVGDFKKTVDGSFNVAKFVIGFIEIVTNYVRVDVLGQNSISILEPANKDLKKHADAVRDLMDALHKDKLTINVANADIVYTLWCQGNDLIGRIPGGHESTSLRASFTNLQNQLTKVKDVFESAHLLNTGVRMVPYTILIRGPSGVGKSAATIPLTNAFLALALEGARLEDFLDNHNQFYYSRQHEQGFWDGYRGQFVCVYDDFGQARDIAGNPDNEFMNFIRSSNLFPNSLHMASLLEKGNTYFRSSLILATTNMTHMNPESIIEPEAVRRRFNTVVDLVPPIEYCTPETRDSPNIWGRRLDKSKLIGGFDSNACQFYEFSYRDNQHTGRIFSFKEMVFEMVKVFRKHRLEHVAYSSDVEKLKSEYVNMRDSFEAQMDTNSESEQFLEGVQGDFDFQRFLLFYNRVPKTRQDKLRYVATLSEIMPECSLATLTLDLFSVVGGQLTDFCLLIEAGVPLHSIITTMVQNVMMEEFVLFDHITAPVTFFGKVQLCLNKIFGYLQSLYMKTTEILLRYPPLSWVHDHISTFAAHAMCGFVIGVCGNLASQVFIGAALNIFKFVSSILGYGSVNIPEPQASGTNGRGKKSKTEQQKFVRSLREQHSLHSTPLLEAQAAFKNDSSNTQIVDSVVSRNSYELWLNGAPSRAGIVTFVRGHLALMPWHFVMHCAEAIEEVPERAQSFVVLKKIASTIEFKVPILSMLNAKQVTNFETLDVCLVDLDVANVPNHCDITKFFVPMQLATKSNDFFVRLCVPGIKGNENWCTKAAPQNNKVVGIDPSDQTVIRFGYNYSAMTKVGDCGGLLTLVDPTSGAKKILGIHTCGSPSQGLGFSSAVFYEDLMDCVALFEHQIIEELHVEGVSQSAFVIGDGRFESLYAVSKGVNLPIKSKIVPSEVIDMWGPHISAPAALRPVMFEGVSQDPMFNALSKYCTPDVVIDPTLLDHVEQSLYDDLKTTSAEPFEARVLSFEEAVLGLTDEDFNAISRSTSCGYPYNVDIDGRFPGKTRFFGSGDVYDLSGEECQKLKIRVLAIAEDASRLIRHEHIFTDYLKDERRPIAKTLCAKTRLISACPLELLILYRMYFGTYVVFCQKNRINNGFATGVNCYSNEWEMIAHKLKSVGADIGAGDYSTFDGSEKNQVHKMILNIIDRFYNASERDINIRHVLWLELINSKHIAGNKIYAWLCSLPSGHPLTTLINNHYNHIAFRLVWLHVHSNDPLSLVSFREHVYLITLGDDNVFSVSKTKIHIFNESILEECMPMFGLTYTNETKSGASHVSRDITEVTFLKRSFRYEPILDRYVAPLNLDVILEMPYWTVQGKLSHTIPCTTFETALVELSLHDKITFDTLAPPMLNAFAEKYNFHPATSSRYMNVLKSAQIRESW
jgi:hypothetical protein